MNKTEAQKKIEELVGRIDVVKAEIRRVQAEAIQYSSVNEVVPAREAEQDIARLKQRQSTLEAELKSLAKFW